MVSSSVEINLVNTSGVKDAYYIIVRLPGLLVHTFFSSRLHEGDTLVWRKIFIRVGVWMSYSYTKKSRLLSLTKSTCMNVEEGVAGENQSCTAV